tara:strand:+ start:210 stop:782 length:573 start_codon:yes stop_codon:yes gene_type:complete
MAAVQMLAGVGLMMACCSSSSLMMMMGDEKKEDPGEGAYADPDYTESCDDLGGGILERHEADVDIDSCKQKCSDDLDCLGISHKVDVGFCQLHDNKDPLGVDICDKGYTLHRDATGKTPLYTSSCDDLGGGVLERHESGYDLSQCKTKCNADTSCKGIVHTAATGFCQLHDNNESLRVDVCDKGYKIYRK